jgi:hypothetical protein
MRRSAQIADFSHVTRFDLSHAEIEQMAQGTVFDLHARRAIIAPDDEGYGYARMYESLRKAAGSTGIAVFRSLDEALDWAVGKRQN